MRFLVTCPISTTSLQSRLGTAEYSYRFVLEGFRPVLARLGEVLEVEDPEATADRLYDEAMAAGHDCRLLCFCPPNLAPVGLRCPTTVVLAWEFDSIPTDPWEGDPRNDWRTVLGAHGQVITLSSHSRQAVQDALGDRCQVSAIPVPMARVQPASADRRARPDAPVEIAFRGHTTDSRSLVHTPDGCLPADTLAMRSQGWRGDEVTLSFREDSTDGVCTLGCYDAEVWGTWSRVANPSILLPFPLVGKVEVQFTAVSYGHNVGRTVDLTIGGQRFPLVLTEAPSVYSISVRLKRPTNLITIGPLDVEPTPGASDSRTLGIGLVTVQVKQAKSKLPRFLRPRPLAEPHGTAQLSGVVFTTVFNPRDGRKNWTDILSAFCYALGDRDDATLVLKTTHHSATAYAETFLELMAAIGPVRARVVVLHGFLDTAAYRQLIEGTTWYVNASRGEGLCLPLMEFMAGGVPAIAPNHTAMADYVDASSTLLVRSNRTPTRWPNDPAKRNRTRWHEIDWQSLVAAFEEGYAIATSEPRRYAAMSNAAAAAVTRYAAGDRVEGLLAEHFGEAA